MTSVAARWKGLALLGLLLLSALPPSVPLAKADSTGSGPSPSLCFDRDAPAPGTPSPADPVNPTDPAPVPPAPNGHQCPGGIPDPPNYYEGQPVYIRLYNLPQPPANVPPPAAYVRISCTANCHETEGRNYYARWTDDVQRPLLFPDDFHQSGPNGETGGNALLDRAPRYNGTWDAALIYGGTQQLSRPFNVWLFDLFTSQNATLVPGESHVFRAAGFEQNATLDLRVERMTADGTFVTTSSSPSCARESISQNPTVFPNFDFFCAWNVPKDEATRIGECPATHRKDCYRVRATGSGTTKANETVSFAVSVADIQITFLVGQFATSDTTGAGRSQAIERTEVASVALDLHYPGGRLHQGPPFSPLDLVPTTDADPSLLVRVLRSNATSSTNVAPTEVGEIRLRFVPSHYRWETNWTVPRDIDLSDATTVFQLQLAQARDRFGNRIPETLLGNYTVSAAHLAPTILANLTTLERTADAGIALDIRYHNGSLFTDQENVTQLRGCYVSDPGQGQDPVCTNATSNTVGSFENNTWVFHYHFKRDEANLGAYKFVLIGGASTTTDRWGNSINRTVSTPFDLVAASQRIAFTTAMRGRDTKTLERGETIGLQAIITYPDGSPFNHTVRSAPTSTDATFLNVTLTRRGPSGDVQSTEIVPLREYDTERGVWAATFPISLDDSTSPAGRWSFDFFVNDTVAVPNVNRTTFDRDIVPAPLRFEPMTITNTRPQTGSTMGFTFRVLYRDGAAVAPDLLRNSLLAQVYRFDTKNRTATGDPVSSFLQPEWSQANQWWSVQYVVPGHLYNGSFVFVVTGHDPSGNLLPQDAYSRTFAPVSLVITRPVITQPPLQVQRGDAATVVFAAQDGDVGVDGTGAPAIRVERYDPDSDSWNAVTNGTDVRQADPTIRDHFGVYPVTTTTAIGTYRFVLYGRNAAPSFAIITNASANFTVLPTDVARDILTLPPREIVKGDLVEFNIQRFAGDRITDVVLRLNGRDTTLPRPLITDASDHLNVSWRVPFDAPSGNYTLHIDGRDQFGNNIHVDSPTFEATAAQLAGKVIGNPGRVVTRGTAATLLFGVTYPNGAFYTASDTPKAFVYNESGLVATATVQRDGVTFQASWTPPLDAATGKYWFEVSGAGRGGNAFPPLRSNVFELAPGSFDRKPEAQLGSSYERFTAIGLIVPRVEGDRQVSFELQYFGPLTDLTDVDTKQPVSRTTLPHLVDTNLSRYVAHFATDQQTPLGLYRIAMKGTDGLGNSISTTTGGFILHSTLVLSTLDDQTPQSAFGEGKKLTLTFTTRYKNGPIMDDSLGRPSVAFLLGGRPTTQHPDIVYVDGHWIATLTLPAPLPKGDYNFVIGGADAFGNTISSQKSNVLLWDPTLGSSFAKVVPGPGPVFAIVGVAMLALALGRVRRARK